MKHTEVININTNADVTCKYVIVRYKNSIVEYLADNNKCNLNWTRNIKQAKTYINLSAADIKVGNLKYSMHPVNACVKYVTKGRKLADPRRRSGYGR